MNLNRTMHFLKFLLFLISDFSYRIKGAEIWKHQCDRSDWWVCIRNKRARYAFDNCQINVGIDQRCTLPRGIYGIWNMHYVLSLHKFSIIVTLIVCWLPVYSDMSILTVSIWHQNRQNPHKYIQKWMAQTVERTIDETKNDIYNKQHQPTKVTTIHYETSHTRRRSKKHFKN